MIYGFYFKETETFLRVTPFIPQFRRYPGFQKEAVRETPDFFQIFRGFTVLLIIDVLCGQCRSAMESLFLVGIWTKV